MTTLQSKSSVHVDGQPIHVDPELLFQRLIVTSNAIDDRKALFRFELCSYPSALSDDTLMPRAPQKAVLANAIWTRLPPDIAGPTGEVQHVLDGGALLHRITWPHGFPTNPERCALYCDYLWRNFGPAIVVFDGYRIPSTKYTTHQRRTGGKVGIEVTFTGYMKLTMSKVVFLSNVANKHNFIDMLSHYLQLAGCLTGGGRRPVDCANNSAIDSYEEHCPRGRRYRSGHPAMLLRRSRWRRLVRAVFDTGDNEEEPPLGYQSHPK